MRRAAAWASLPSAPGPGVRGVAWPPGRGAPRCSGGSRWPCSPARQASAPNCSPRAGSPPVLRLMPLLPRLGALGGRFGPSRGLAPRPGLCAPQETVGEHRPRARGFLGEGARRSGIPSAHHLPAHSNRQGYSGKGLGPAPAPVKPKPRLPSQDPRGVRGYPGLQAL